MIVSKKVFPVLFGGGEARLILIEDPEKGEMGIDIVSRPPGKKSTKCHAPLGRGKGTHCGLLDFLDLPGEAVSLLLTG